jgi:hypothetical protein
MAETDLHRKLVRGLAGIVRRREECSWLLFIDGEDDHSHGCPPQLFCVRPDVYARESRTGHVLIGEAKTASDIENDHTAAQLSVYFQHLSTHPSGEFLFAVSLMHAGLAYRFCNVIRKQAGCPHVPFQVTGWMFGPRTFVRAWRG